MSLPSPLPLPAPTATPTATATATAALPPRFRPFLFFFISHDGDLPFERPTSSWDANAAATSAATQTAIPALATTTTAAAAPCATVLLLLPHSQLYHSTFPLRSTPLPAPPPAMVSCVVVAWCIVYGIVACCVVASCSQALGLCYFSMCRCNINKKPRAHTINPTSQLKHAPLYLLIAQQRACGSNDPENHVKIM